MTQKPNHDETTHPLDRLGETCDCCGTEYRVIEELPDKPVNSAFLAGLEESDSFAFARGVTMFDPSLFEVDSDTRLTEDIVLSTQNATRVLSRHEGVGWVVSLEFDHAPDEDPQSVGFEVWTEASNRISKRLDQML